MTAPSPLPSRVDLIHLPRRAQGRGSLWVAELGAALPFAPERLFFVDQVPAGTCRGGHANADAHELLVAVRGQVRVVLGPHPGDPEIVLDEPGIALHLPPLVWATQVYGPDALLLVAASTVFDANGHIHNPSDPRLRWD